MCRMLISLGRVGALADYHDSLVTSLIKASRYDPYNEALYGPRYTSHRDGWGRVFIKIFHDDVESVCRKSTRPIFVDMPRFSLGEADGDAFFVEVLHSRASSLGMLINLFSTHPIELSTECGYKLYLAHNGEVNKEAIIGMLGTDTGIINKDIFNDSFYLAKYFSMNTCDHLDFSVLRDVIDIVEEALNLGVVLVTDRYVDVLVGSYYRTDKRGDRMRDFYKLYKAELSDLVVYASSTLIDFDEYNPGLPFNWTELGNGYYEIYRIYLGENRLVYRGSYNI